MEGRGMMTSRYAASTNQPVALILGSGFSGLSGIVKPMRRISYAQMEGLETAVLNQNGQVPEATVGTVDGVSVIVYPRRLHLYHGHSAYQVASLVRHAYASGCRVALFVGASGLVGEGEIPQLGVVSDHINLTGENPLVGWQRAGDSFVPMADAYDPELRTIACDIARERRIDLDAGVYAELKGPSLETPAEARALELLGVRYAGMSLSLETIMARALGMRVLALTLATNAAGEKGVSHQTVRAESTSYTRELSTIVRGVLARM